MVDSKKDKKSNFLDRLEEKNPTLYFFVDLILNIVIIVLLVYTIRTYFISPFQVYGPSMCDSLNHINSKCQEGFGEYLIVNKALYYSFFGYRLGKPERGDVIVFRPPHNSKDFYIKRIIGLPGERIKIQNGKVFIFNKEHQSGFELHELYLNRESKNQTYSFPSQLVASYEIPENYYFVLGDNRKKSTDSRTCFRGPVDQDCKDSVSHLLEINRIEGKAWVVLWPFNKMRVLPDPDYEERVK